MIKLVLITAALISTSVFAGEYPVVIKDQTPVALEPGVICYDEASVLKIDEAQKAGVECLVKLKQSERTIKLLQSKPFEIVRPGEPLEQPDFLERKFFDKPIVKYGIPVLIGLGLGVGIGLAIGASL